MNGAGAAGDAGEAALQFQLLETRRAHLRAAVVEAYRDCTFYTPVGLVPARLLKQALAIGAIDGRDGIMLREFARRRKWPVGSDDVRAQVAALAQPFMGRGRS